MLPTFNVRLQYQNAVSRSRRRLVLFMMVTLIMLLTFFWIMTRDIISSSGNTKNTPPIFTVMSTRTQANTAAITTPNNDMLITTQQDTNNFISSSPPDDTTTDSSTTTTITTRRTPKLGDGCNSIYLDIGTNIGVQIRKLFEPQLYASAPYLQYFYQAFGNVTERREPGAVCVFGFEPGPWHKNRLDYLENCYNSMGWKVKIFRVVASNTDKGYANFFRDDVKATQDETSGSQHDFQDWGSSEFTIKDLHGGNAVKVKKMSIANFINEHIVGRLNNVYKGSRKPYVLAKMDVEGSEYQVLTRMLFSGALCHVNKITLEWHPKHIMNGNLPDEEKKLHLNVRNLITTFTNQYSEAWTGCQHAKIEEFDEETYYNDGMKFPKKCMAATTTTINGK
jgi:hypothetical protein